ncbi:cysteine proteinase [Suhomyces tanzawaensis NRRL Y-17324]|uniref:ubiquitinyl hydrolase 1 n=1 Tax=Suhomyces tanzawaensis NRRL Y-17324 TaxID=984487 RepID=A0A1E4SHM4_9ASCO|nr:cysteine proteinase [Suhomyces tanzawaensis NRRL Y-17324]ODV79014.1 cysteine proteinase [Suhomyces tanzawaensis NRRL Y-17324]
MMTSRKQPPPVPAEAPARPRGPIPLEQFSALPGPYDVKHHYNRMINQEFRNLQLDLSLQSKSLFDLIDYCELLYEKSSQALKHETTRSGASASSHDDAVSYYIKGYLIFNYFINSFIMLHFKGFDAFIEANEQDFIIYLNVFAFYNTEDYVTLPHSIPLKTLRQYVLGYLVEKNLLSFNVEELYAWLHQYIDYLKQKDLSYDQHQHPDSLPKSNKSYNLNDLSHDDDLVLDFKMRYPSVNAPAETDTESEQESYYVLPNRLDSSLTEQPRVLPPPPASPPPPPEHYTPLPRLLKPNGPPPVPANSPPKVPPPKAVPRASTMAPYPIENQILPIVDATERSKTQDDLYFNNRSSSFQTPNQQKNRWSMHEATAFSHLQPGNQSTGQFSNFNQNGYNDFDTTPKRVNEHLSHGRNDNSMAIAPGPGRYNRPSQALPIYKGPAVALPTNVHAHSHNRDQYRNGYAQANGFTNAPQPGTSLYGPYNGQGPSHPSIIPHHVQVQQNQIKNHKLNYMKDYAVCGLKNFGSSCYINLTIQLLFGIHQLRDLFSHLEYHKYIKDPKFIKLMKQLKEQSHSKDESLLSESISGLLRTFKLHGSSSIAPTRFTRIASVLKPNFNIPYEQQDAQEFLIFVLERLHEELSNKPSSEHFGEQEFEKYIRKWDINILLNEKKDYTKWYQSLLQTEGISPVNDLFQGHIQNKLVCNKCNYESVNYSSFTILSLPIPSSNGRNSVIDLSDCLRYYTQDEVLSGDNAWNCPKCNEKDGSGHALDNHPVFTPKRSGIFKLGRRSKSPPKTKNAVVKTSQNSQISTKKLNFIKLPRVLFIHLSRFSMFNLTDKLDVSIKYPLILKFKDHHNHEIGYKLSGLINHYGNLKSGHYTALVNKSTINEHLFNADNLKHPYWCLFDDDTVKVNLPHGNINQPQFQELNSRDVYVLCYERI